MRLRHTTEPKIGDPTNAEVLNETDRACERDFTVSGHRKLKKQQRGCVTAAASPGCF